MKRLIWLCVSAMIFSSLSPLCNHLGIINYENDFYANEISENVSYMQADTRPDDWEECDNKSQRIVTPVRYYDSYMKGYFSGLTKNLGVNYKGSCGYVALAELLTYYDNIFDDNIVYEKYDIISESDTNDFIKECNSPGSLWDEMSRDIIESYGVMYDESKSLFENGKSINNTNYYKYIESIKDKSLHAKLITIGYRLGYYDYRDPNKPYAYNADAPCETNSAQRNEIIIEYFKELGYMAPLYVSYSRTSETTSEEGIKKFTKTMIDNDFPVLLSVANKEGSHAAIAYDYDDNYIYANMGWGGKRYARFPIEQMYNKFLCAEVLSINPNKFHHVHTNNYKGIDSITGDRKSYCYCNCAIITYKPIEHIHNVDYAQFNSTYHKSYCECMNYILEEHDLIPFNTEGPKPINPYSFVPIQLTVPPTIKTYQCKICKELIHKIL